MKNKLNLLIRKYRNFSLPVKAAMWFTICSFMQRGISMITTPIFTRVLSTTEYGIYSTYLSWENVLLLVVSLTMYGAVLNLNVKYDDRNMVLSSVSGLELLITSLWLVIAIIFREQLSQIMQLSTTLVCCMFVYFVFFSIIQCWTFHKRYVYGYKTLIIATLFITFGSAVLGALAVVFISPTAEMRAISSTLVVVCVGIPICISIFKHDKRFFNKDIWKFAFSFSFALLPLHLSEFVLQSSDKIMINYMYGASDVAIYSVAYSVGSLISMIAGSLNHSFSPYQYQKMADRDYKSLAKRADQIMLLIAVMLVLIMVFSKEIVLIFGGEKYMESADVIIPICIGVFFNYLLQIFSRVQQFYEKKLTIVIPSVMCAVVNLVLNYIFINLYGYAAAAYTTFISYLMFCIVHYVFYKRLCRKLLDGVAIFDIRGLVLISISVIVGGFAVTLLSNHFILKYALIAIFLFIVFIKRRTVANYIKENV